MAGSPRDSGAFGIGEVERCRHDADDREDRGHTPALSEERNGAADDGAVGAVRTSPQSVAQDDGQRVGRFVAGRDRPAERRGHAEDVEEVGCDQGAPESFGSILEPDIELRFEIALPALVCG